MKRRSGSLAHLTSWASDDDCVGGNVFRDDRPRADHGAIADRDARHDRDACPDPDVRADRYAFRVRFRLLANQHVLAFETVSGRDEGTELRDQAVIADCDRRADGAEIVVLSDRSVLADAEYPRSRWVLAQRDYGSASDS